LGLLFFGRDLQVFLSRGLSTELGLLVLVTCVAPIVKLPARLGGFLGVVTGLVGCVGLGRTITVVGGVGAGRGTCVLGRCATSGVFGTEGFLTVSFG
jgi:hypothetical protein